MNFASTHEAQMFFKPMSFAALCIMIWHTCSQAVVLDRGQAANFCRRYLETSATSPAELRKSAFAAELGPGGVFTFLGTEPTHAHEIDTLRRYLKFRGGVALSTDGFLGNISIPIVDAVYFWPDSSRVTNLSLKRVGHARINRTSFLNRKFEHVCASVRGLYSPAAIVNFMNQHRWPGELEAGDQNLGETCARALAKLFGLAVGEGETSRPIELVYDLSDAWPERAEIAAFDARLDRDEPGEPGDDILCVGGRVPRRFNLSALGRRMQREGLLERATLMLARQVLEIDKDGFRMHDLDSRRVLTKW